jgi:hypothetical protein
MLRCPYCGFENPLGEKHKQAESLGSANAEYIIPLTIDQDDLRFQTEQFMASGDYTPDDMIDASEIVKLDLHYVPGYISEGDFTAKWTASFGYDREEEYTDYETRNGNSVAVKKTKTVIDWSPMTGTALGSFSVMAYGGRDIKSPKVIELIESVPDISRTKFSPSYLSGYDVECYALTQSDVSDKLYRKYNGVVSSKVHSHAQGDHQKDWKWNSTADEETSTILLPVCHSVFTYKGKEYDFWLDGVADKHIASELPKDNRRCWSVWKGFLPFFLSLILLVSFAFSFSSDRYGSAYWPPTIAAVTGCLLFGFYRRHAILEYSIKVRESKLAQRQMQHINVSSEQDAQALMEKTYLPDPNIFVTSTKDTMLICIIGFCSMAIVLYSGAHIFLR